MSRTSPPRAYNVLLIVTDGVITDMADTERAIVEVGWGRRDRDQKLP